jgi:tetratricopeptide (TPR) repeat protein
MGRAAASYQVAEALSKESTNEWEPKLMMACSLNRLKKHTEALSILRGLESVEAVGRCRVEAGFAYEGLGKWKEALDAYDSALSSDAKDAAKVVVAKASLLLNSRDENVRNKKEALLLAERAMKLLPGDRPSIILVLAQALAMNARVEQALTRINQLDVDRLIEGPFRTDVEWAKEQLKKGKDFRLSRNPAMEMD